MSNKAYVSALADGSAIISGPPATLESLSEFSTLVKQNRKDVLVHGPYHASHLHGKVDAAAILGSSTEVLDTFKTRIPIISTSTGSWFDIGTNSSELVTRIIHDVLEEPLNLQRCLENINFPQNLGSKVIPLGPIGSSARFVNAVGSKLGADILSYSDFQNAPQKSLTKQSQVRSKKPKIAIVGIAGRFPNAADHEKFWDLLYAGLDVHRKVRYYSRDLFTKCSQITGTKRSV